MVRPPAALVAAGSNPGTGRDSQAHQGVLFLDELPEFDSQGYWKLLASRWNQE